MWYEKTERKRNSWKKFKNIWVGNVRRLLERKNIKVQETFQKLINKLESIGKDNLEMDNRENIANDERKKNIEEYPRQL